MLKQLAVCSTLVLFSTIGITDSRVCPVFPIGEFAHVFAGNNIYLLPDPPNPLHWHQTDPNQLSTSFRIFVDKSSAQAGEPAIALDFALKEESANEEMQLGPVLDPFLNVQHYRFQLAIKNPDEQPKHYSIEPSIILDVPGKKARDIVFSGKVEDSIVTLVLRQTPFLYFDKHLKQDFTLWQNNFVRMKVSSAGSRDVLPVHFPRQSQSGYH